MGVSIRVSRKRLYLDVYVGGRRHWESLGLLLTGDKETDKETRHLAEIIAAKRRMQIATGEYGLVDPIAGKETLVGYAEKIAKRYNSVHPLSVSIRYLREFSGERRMKDVDERFVEDYRDFLTKTGLSQVTAANYFNALKAIMKRALRDRVIIRNPATVVRGIPIPDSNKPLLSSNELAALARTNLDTELEEQVKRAFMLGCNTGFRISDLKNLTWGEIDREHREIRKRQTKTGNVTTVPLNGGAWSIVNDGKLHHRQEQVFPLINNRANLNDILVRWAKRAGLERRLGFHDARRYFATNAIAAGADVTTVSKMLGHKKLAQIQAYAQVSDSMKRAAVEGLPEIRVSREEA